MQGIRLGGPVPTLLELMKCVFDSHDDTRYHTIQRYLSLNLGLPMDLVHMICQFANVRKGVTLIPNKDSRVYTIISSNIMLRVMNVSGTEYGGDGYYNLSDCHYIKTMMKYDFREGRLWVFAETGYNDPYIETSYIKDYDYTGRRVYLRGEKRMAEVIRSSAKQIIIERLHTRKRSDEPWTTIIATETMNKTNRVFF